MILICNKNLGLYCAIRFPVLYSPVPAEGLFPEVFRIYLMTSIVLTTYGFGRGAAGNSGRVQFLPLAWSDAQNKLSQK
jgi:hypothetical protein